MWSLEKMQMMNFLRMRFHSTEFTKSENKGEKLMEENKTKELINVFSNTYELIRQAAHILDHESMTKVCQHDEDFQNRVLDLIVGICRTRVYTEVEFQDWSQYEEGKSSNGGCYMFSEHYYYSEQSDLWHKEYETSADFEYCPVCGRFENHIKYNEDESFAGYSCGRYTVISAAKLINIVIQFMLDYKDDEKHMMIVK